MEEKKEKLPFPRLQSETPETDFHHEAVKNLRKAYQSFLPLGETRFKHIQTAAAATRSAPRHSENAEKSGSQQVLDVSNIHLGRYGPVKVDPTHFERPSSIPLEDFQTAGFFLADNLPDETKRHELLHTIFISGNYDIFFSDQYSAKRDCLDDDLNKVHKSLVKLAQALICESKKWEKSGNSMMENKFNKLVVLADRLCDLAAEFIQTKDVFKYDEKKTFLGMQALPSTQCHMAAMFKELGIPKNYRAVARNEVETCITYQRFMLEYQNRTTDISLRY